MPLASLKKLTNKPSQEASNSFNDLISLARHFPVKFSNLMGTSNEAAAIVNDAHKLGYSDVGMFTTTNATEDNFRKEATNAFVLHLATHGMFFPIELARRRLTDPPMSGSGTDLTSDNEQNPMHASVLALSGANWSWSAWQHTSQLQAPSEDDGILTASEVAELNLERTWLVVLSACDSGIGDVVNGEGVMGMRRGFAQAGAQHVLMSLWTVVDERGSPEFFNHFYQKAIKTKNPATALCAVQREMLRNTSMYPTTLRAVRFLGPYVINSIGH
jgi:CHAT domain-containing protein